jgi:hypothetical protein
VLGELTVLNLVEIAIRRWATSGLVLGHDYKVTLSEQHVTLVIHHSKAVVGKLHQPSEEVRKVVGYQRAGWM